MAVSDRHGGGLTLQRILGGDLLRFRGLVSVGSFGRSLRAAPKLLGISRQIDFPLDAFPVRTDLLRRLKSFFRGLPLIQNWELKMAWRRFAGTIKEKTPRLLVCPQGMPSVWLAAKAVQVLGTEYITWVMDDHPLKATGKALSYSPEFRRLWAEHLRGARKVFVISAEMGDFYRENFGVESDVLHGALPLESVRRTIPQGTVRHGTLRLGYAGSLSGWQQGPLELLAAVSAQAGAELHVASHWTPEWLANASVVHRGEMPSEEAFAFLSDCDAVVLPISFLPQHTAMSRFNIATKLSELCACGRPILAIGPSDSAMVRILSKHDAAVCVTELVSRDVFEGLKKLKMQEMTDRFVGNAQRLFEKELNLGVMQRRWRDSGDWLFADGR